MPPTTTRIETGRSFRDLPPHPPTGEIPLPPPPESPEGTPDAASRRWWPWLALIGALALLAGLAVGLWAPWDRAVPPLAAPTTSSTPLDPIVPPGLPSTTLPEPAPPFGGTPFSPPTTPPDSGRFSFRFPGLVDPASIPDPYEVSENGVEIDPSGVRQRMVLEGPGERLVVEADLTGDGAMTEEGEPVQVRGTEGRMHESPDGIALTWVEDGIVRVRIQGPAGTDPAVLLELAERLEVAP